MSKRYQGGILGVGFNPLQAPNAPTGVTASAGATTADVSFTAPSNVGGSAVSGYTGRSDPEGVTATAATSPLSFAGLTEGVAYTFNVWALNSYGPSPAGTSNTVTPAARGVFGGGSEGFTSVISYVTISTAGNATSFGNLTDNQSYFAACASNTRGVFGGGYNNVNLNILSYITIATAGNATSFGTLTGTRVAHGGCSSATRGLYGGGSTAFSGGVLQSSIDYITIATTGNATNFGNLTATTFFATAACASPTRGLFGGGNSGGATTRVNAMDYVTIATTGNATSFGQLVASTGIYYMGSCSSSTRGLFAGGLTGSVQLGIQYVTIATTGNATSFGNLTAARQGLSACSSPTRGVFAGGKNGSGVKTNTIDYVTIGTTGNATAFGGLTATTYEGASCSNGHGGL